VTDRPRLWSPRVGFPLVVPRGSATLAACVALALAVGGCASASMSAAELRVPVLLGPVPCIGCTAGARLPTPAPLARIAGHERVYAFFLGVGIVDDRQPGIPADLLYWTPCHDDLQLSNLRAHSWQIMVPLLVYIYDASVTADATEVAVPVPGSACSSP
jgi:hypothetical protein